MVYNSCFCAVVKLDRSSLLHRLLGKLHTRQKRTRGTCSVESLSLSHVAASIVAVAGGRDRDSCHTIDYCFLLDCLFVAGFVAESQ